MNFSQQQALAQAEASNAMLLPYKPSEAYGTAAAKLCEMGYLDRGATGGWWLSESGKRALALARTVNSRKR